MICPDTETERQLKGIQPNIFTKVHKSRNKRIRTNRHEPLPFRIFDLTPQEYLGVARWPIREFGHTYEATFFIKTRSLETVGREPHEMTAARGGFRHRSVDECPTQAMAPVDIVHPELPNLCHSGPAVASDHSYLRTIRIENLKSQTPTIVMPSSLAVVAVKIVV